MICCWLYDLKHICDKYFNFFKNKNKRTTINFEYSKVLKPDLKMKKT